ncbi:MAG: bifunctional diaminohydroxyphosphoribosylaminopyrimidine deaminase/5-amino-6-(5-phosphoribosylamino)uracil reductase RibD [Pseudomonadota bacterium]
MAGDIHFLHHAIRIGARGLGRTWPNPSVGCVLVKGDQILATARSGDGGRPHAEATALAIAGAQARGATAYVTLEPCAHHGKTPPCAQALIDAGVARVVYGCADPDPRVNGKGAAMLRAAGIAVDYHPIAAATHTHRGFIRRVTDGVPYVAMKIASSLDGQMADADGKSQWITGPSARRHGHALRSGFDAILTGIGTVLADDPALTARDGGAPNPYLVRVVADRQLRLPLRSQLVRTAEQQPTWVVTGAEAVERAASHATELREAGVKFLVLEETATADGAVPALLTRLAAEGINRLLVEAGPTLSTAFLDAGVVETLYWYRAPMLLGNAGKSAIAALHSRLDNAARALPAQHTMLGPDVCERYEFTPCSPA